MIGCVPNVPKFNSLSQPRAEAENVQHSEDDVGLATHMESPELLLETSEWQPTVGLLWSGRLAERFRQSSMPERFDPSMVWQYSNKCGQSQSTT